MNASLPAPILLGIESSCDDTAAAVVAGGVLRSNVVSSQRVHAGFGGVVPELASRAHQRLIVPVVTAALDEAGVERADLDAVAVTYGPGLAGSLLVGLSFAKAFALALDRPLVGVNHLEGHIYSVFIEAAGGTPVAKPSFPYLCLVVSGGHTELILVEAGFRHTLLGRTRDDAAGEAFDKVAKLLGLGYPGGPAIDRLAATGDPSFHPFPRTRLDGFDFSFSGIKTAVLYYLNRFPETERARLLEKHLPDLCAAFQQAVVDMLIDPLRRAVQATGVRHVAVVGGVSANTGLRAAAGALSREAGFTLYTPDPAYCMDNAAMIAVTAHFKLAAGHTSPLTLTAEPALALR
ncbi:tRNA (adenosine(37)-N6)-threonylcarbamoyltransferase complex transferase subunit TsaD [Rhodocaloribacter litoris]|uniref:tRNA (adenosine(37)-N6)-threonylcarbamoyltransferase complex transferase subunit TsaD n=1 Tax=Rhodocaloribacter litoris TaxID=2558931 RepID=UPI00141F27EF|nr:tRNA (adenosine(37)-N6)-threonylcarbamoyltransferase complex transferase subunit TsaD [Rhodocaloribacter litoris]QXD16335.1 tRNA (adenosine(37)-N6)-threonylcarbamoyltransferase complex transferase subunit TsaD [Rhodocaloribacter litoris]